MKNFVAFDFETANASRTSVCSVGMVFVENNRVRETVYELINPEGYFDSRNTEIHGITEEDVVNAPTFDVFYEGVKDKLENQLLVAHFLPFDGYVLRDSLDRYQLTPVEKRLMCSYQLAKKLLPDLSSHTLKSMCRHFRIGLDQHHHALADARACADLFVHLTELGNIEDEKTLLAKTGIRVGKLTPSSFRTSRIGKKTGKMLDLHNIQADRDADEGHVFYGKKMVFTGKLEGFSRKQAAEMVAAKGGQSINSISADTDFIILGGSKTSLTGRKSSKLVLAERLINAGYRMKIISEEEFLKLLG